ncbi:MAG: hypothetical protein ACIPMY_04335 [Rickettsia endosymbiont of Pentastiridius leporinus]
MLKSENIQKSGKTSKVIHEEFFIRTYGLTPYSIFYMDYGTTAHNEFTLPYLNNNIKIIGHDAEYFHKYFAGFGFE